jgi:hypothetical protein
VNAQHARLARNEALFREVNERIADVSGSYGLGDELEFLCECGRQECFEALPVTRAVYEAVREKPDRFLVAPGHENPEIERVVEEHDRYYVVEKVGEAGAIAEEADPRS